MKMNILAGVAISFLMVFLITSNDSQVEIPFSAMTDNVFSVRGVQRQSIQQQVVFQRQSQNPFTILAFGDVMLGRNVRTLMDKYGKDYIFSEFDKNIFKGPDVVFTNLEGPIKGAGRSGGTSMVFSFNEDVAPYLKNLGFTLVSIANNHAVDQGWDGRDTTISALEKADIGWCGHPSEADPSSVYYGKDGDKTYAFLCFHDITFKLDRAAAVELIKTVRPNVDYVIVSIHWGLEYKTTPSQILQVEPAHEFIDAGADFIIGHHPHVVESFEIYKNKFIFYSLGNFVFDQYWSVPTQEELGIGIIFDNEKTGVYLYPMKSSNSKPRLLTGNEKTKWIEKFIGYGTYSDEIKNMIRGGMIEISR